MTRKQALSSSTKLTMATVVAAGLAAAPVAFGPGSLLESHSAAAQQQDEGYAQERTERKLDPQPVGTHDGVYETLGTTRDQAEGAADQIATAQYGKLETYQAEVERNNLEGAAQVLAVVARRPITEAMVVDVNTQLGIETDLTAHQIAEHGAAIQEETGQRTEAADGTVIIVTDPAILGVAVVETGAAETGDYDAQTVYGLLGTTAEQAAEDQRHIFATAQYGPLEAYQAAVERGNLDAAAENLAAVSKRPITESLVVDVNRELGVETRLTATQIADHAAQKQDEMN